MTEIIYDSSKIKVLRGIDAVRKRPGMYIGGTDIISLHHLFFEAMHGPIIKAKKRNVKKIWADIISDCECAIFFDGTSFPINSEHSLPCIETLLSDFWYEQANNDWMWLVVVNALSERFHLEVWRENHYWSIEYECGILIKPWREEEYKKTSNKIDGTKIQFRYDSKIFDTGVSFSVDLIKRRAKEIVALIPGLELFVRSGPSSLYTSYLYKMGIIDLVSELCGGMNQVDKPYYEKAIKDNIEVEVALVWCEDFSQIIWGYANTVRTREGKHIDGFVDAIMEESKDYFKEFQMKNDDVYYWVKKEDIFEGAIAIVSVVVPSPKYRNPTKEILSNPEVYDIVKDVVKTSFRAYLRNSLILGNFLNKRAISSIITHRAPTL